MDDFFSDLDIVVFLCSATFSLKLNSICRFLLLPLLTGKGFDFHAARNGVGSKTILAA